MLNYAQIMQTFRDNENFPFFLRFRGKWKIFLNLNLSTTAKPAN